VALLHQVKKAPVADQVERVVHAPTAAGSLKMLAPTMQLKIANASAPTPSTRGGDDGGAGESIAVLTAVFAAVLARRDTDSVRQGLGRDLERWRARARRIRADHLQYQKAEHDTQDCNKCLPAEHRSDTIFVVNPAVEPRHIRIGQIAD
jgi:hypothetical protein